MFIEYINEIYFFILFVSFVLLIFLSLEDIKEKKISRNLTLITLGILLIFHIVAFVFFEYLPSYESLLAVVLLGSPAILCVLITKEKALGMGDVYLFMIMGLIVGSQYLLYSLSLMVLSALLFVLFKYGNFKLKRKIPLVPFITFGILVTTLLKYLVL
jgi:prepilin signal peptidase PulO-like enzyme (type II secretory pathway)